MKNEKKIMKKIKAIGLRVEIADSGFLVYPKEESYLLCTAELDKLIAIAQKYNLRHYVNFEEGYIRLFYEETKNE